MKRIKIDRLIPRNIHRLLPQKWIMIINPKIEGVEEIDEAEFYPLIRWLERVLILTPPDSDFRTGLKHRLLTEASRQQRYSTYLRRKPSRSLLLATAVIGFLAGVFVARCWNNEQLISFDYYPNSLLG